MNWFFDGLGTAIFTLVLGFFSGGAVGYRVGIKKSIKVHQKQHARDNASQIQIGEEYNGR